MSVALDITEPTASNVQLPLADRFFASAIRANRLAHAYILKGKSYGAMYNLVLQVAQALNCQNKSAYDSGASLAGLACGQCVSCRWVSQNAHPGVLTVSRMTFQSHDNGRDLLSTEGLEKLAKKSEWPTQIKTDQISLLIGQLGRSSDAVRVVIFTDSEELPASTVSDVPAPCEWRSLEATEERSFHIRPLERQVFNEASVNKFLKTLEEPPPNCLFFYIAETEEQLLDTIVSRCQVLPCLSDNGLTGSDSIPAEYQVFLENLVTRIQRKTDVYALASEFETFFQVQAGLSLAQGVEVFQRYLRTRFMNRLLDDVGFGVYREIQQLMETTSRMLGAKTNETQSVLQMFLKLTPLLAQL